LVALAALAAVTSPPSKGHTPKTSLRLTLLAVVCLGFVALAGSSASAAFPGANGKVAFTTDWDGNNEIYVMNPDGTNPTNLTNNAAQDQLPDWEVAPPNTPPVANDDDYSTDEDQLLNVTAPGVLSNDTDPNGDTLTAVKVSDPTNGSLTLNSDGSFTYTPNNGFSGTDSFTYKANDGTNDSNVVTVTITVQPDTTPPTVFSVNPSEGQTGVMRTTNITITFSEEMDTSSLNANTVKLVKVGSPPVSIPFTMQTSTDGSGRTVLTLDPFGSTMQKLGKKTTYKLTVEGANDTDGFAVKDLASNELATDYVSSFKTKRR